MRSGHISHRAFTATALLLGLLSNSGAAPANAPTRYRDVGYVFYTRGALPDSDRLKVVFSERVTDESDKTSLSAAGLEPVPGCFSVVNISASSGLNQLAGPGQITFACAPLPPTAQIVRRSASGWEKTPSWLDEKGRITAAITELTVYAVVSPALLTLNPLSLKNRAFSAS